MRYRFNAEKAIEAAGVLLREEPHRRMTRLRLIKLLYLAERACLEKKGRPLLRARPFALPHGPVPSEVYDLIKGTHSDTPQWSAFFQNDHRDVVMLDEPVVDRLSTYEIQTLQRIAKEHEDENDWELAEFTEQLDEFLQTYTDSHRAAGTSVSIAFDTLLSAIGRLQDKDDITSESARSDGFDDLLAKARG